VDQNIGIFDNRFHSLGIGHEVGRDVAPVELHALDELEGRFHALGLLDRDNAFFPNLFHCLGDNTPDRLVVVGRDRSYLSNFFFALDGRAKGLELGDDT